MISRTLKLSSAYRRLPEILAAHLLPSEGTEWKPGNVVQARVERTFAWLNRNRRLAKDFEVTIQSAVTWLYIASVKLMVRRLAAA